MGPALVQPSAAPAHRGASRHAGAARRGGRTTTKSRAHGAGDSRRRRFTAQAIHGAGDSRGGATTHGAGDSRSGAATHSARRLTALGNLRRTRLTAGLRWLQPANPRGHLSPQARFSLAASMARRGHVVTCWPPPPSTHHGTGSGRSLATTMAARSVSSGNLQEFLRSARCSTINARWSAFSCARGKIAA